MDSVTNIEWAVSWLGGCGTQKREGETIRAYGKDDRNHLVAIRTDSGVYPVRNLSAVLHAEKRACLCWDAAVRLHDGHCCMQNVDGQPPICHEAQAVTRRGKVSAS